MEFILHSPILPASLSVSLDPQVLLSANEVVYPADVVCPPDSTALKFKGTCNEGGYIKVQIKAGNAAFVEVLPLSAPWATVASVPYSVFVQVGTTGKLHHHIGVTEYTVQYGDVIAVLAANGPRHAAQKSEKLKAYQARLEDAGVDADAQMVALAVMQTWGCSEPLLHSALDNAHELYIMGI